MSSKRSQRTKARKANAFKTKKTKKSFRKKGNRLLFQADTGIGPELKSKDTSTTFVAPLTASFATPQLMNGLTQGVGTNERIGRKAIMKSFQMRYTLEGAGGAGDDVSQNRIVVVYDKQANGAAPIATDVFAVNDFNSPLQLNNSDRFIVLLDEMTESRQSSALNISGQRYVKCNLETIYGGTTNAIASINSGSIYMFVANNSDPTIGITSNLYLIARIRYTDE